MTYCQSLLTLTLTLTTGTMSQINPRLSSVGGTQSPPPDDCHPMGACSIEGGNVGGIPDRQQRSRTSRSIYIRTLSQLYPSEYFDPSEHMQEQTQARARPEDVDPQGTTVRIAQDGQQVSLASIQRIGASITSANTFARSAPSTLRALTSMIDCD